MMAARLAGEVMAEAFLAVAPALGSLAQALGRLVGSALPPQALLVAAVMTLKKEKRVLRKHKLIYDGYPK